MANSISRGWATMLRAAFQPVAVQHGWTVHFGGAAGQAGCVPNGEGGAFRDYQDYQAAALLPIELTVYAERALRERPRSSTNGKPVVRGGRHGGRGPDGPRASCGVNGLVPAGGLRRTWRSFLGLDKPPHPKQDPASPSWAD